MMRRDLLTAAPTFAFSTLLATGAQPASARPKPAFVDPHAAWLEEARHTSRAWLDQLDEHGDETAQSSVTWDRHLSARGNILNTPARTIEGMAAQLAWVIEESGDDFQYIDHSEALKLILAGLQRCLAA